MCGGIRVGAPCVTLETLNDFSMVGRCGGDICMGWFISQRIQTRGPCSAFRVLHRTTQHLNRSEVFLMVQIGRHFLPGKLYSYQLENVTKFGPLISKMDGCDMFYTVHRIKEFCGISHFTRQVILPTYINPKSLKSQKKPISQVSRTSPN